MQSQDDGKIAGWTHEEQSTFGGCESEVDHISFVGRLDQLEYIAGLAKTLAHCAERAGSGTLARLLDVAHTEARKELSRG